MNTSEAREYLAEIDEGILLADGFEAALLGYVRQFNRTMALYDRQKCIRILVERDNMSPDEAEEFFEFNVQGAYVGEQTPAFAVLLPPPDPYMENHELDHNP